MGGHDQLSRVDHQLLHVTAGHRLYKCCTNVYSPPTRGYRFDTEFLTLSLLPPKSPAFRDVNTKSFRQVLRPTQ